MVGFEVADALCTIAISFCTFSDVLSILLVDSKSKEGVAFQRISRIQLWTGAHLNVYVVCFWN